MRGILWVVLAILSLSVNALALRLTPYVSGSVQYDIVFAHYGMRSVTSSGWLHDFGCWGSQFDVGVKGRDLTVYLGYHYSASPIYGEMEHWYGQGNYSAYTGLNKNAWREKRYLLGTRWTMNSRGSYPVKPVLGVALSYGISRLEWDYVKYYTDADKGTSINSSSYQLRHSRRNIGTMFEFGFLVHPLSHVDLSIMAQVHRFESNFRDDGDPVTPDQYIVIMPSMEIGLQYLFPALKIGE